MDSNDQLTTPLQEPRRRRTGSRAQSSTTKRAILEASTRLFIEQGYGATTVDDIVRESSISVGSLYHQFGGKAEVFIAMARQEMSNRIAARNLAIQRATEAGETRPDELFFIGTRAHLLEMWKNLALSRVMWGDDVPVGFADHRRRTEAKFIVGAAEVDFGQPPQLELGAYAVIALMHAAALQLLNAPDRGTAAQIIDYFTDLIRRLSRQSTNATS